jgi:hypothetical protein
LAEEADRKYDEVIKNPQEWDLSTSSFLARTCTPLDCQCV